jgi:diaminopimelate decarboxylase
LTLSISSVELTWSQLDALARQHGNSFFLADLDRFRLNFTRLRDCFQARYPRTAIAYSYKTNYLPAFARLADDLDAHAEVVSWFEYEYARALGVDSRRIIFNGPIKSRSDLTRAIIEGAWLNVDSLDELRTLLDLDLSVSAPVAVGLRCHLGDNTPGSRFGIDLASDAGRRAVAAIDGAKQYRLAGLHVHHSANRRAEAYRERAARIVAVHREELDDRPLEYIDIGGGFAGPMPPELSSQVGVTETYDDYAEAIGSIMRDAYGEDGPILILEPGMALVSDAMTFVTRVEVLKSAPGADYAVVDGSVFNIKPLRHSINLPLLPVRRPGVHGMAGIWDVVGHTCMERSVDLLHSGYRGTLSQGDFVMLSNVGAYSTVLNAPFIHGTPPILSIVGGRANRVLRRASTARDLLASYEQQ